MLLAIGIGLYAHQYTGFQSGLLHLFNHAMMKATGVPAVGTVAYTGLARIPRCASAI
jgi:NADH:ubiquinone oxidoreductase subunit 5 (subunit L)/multisubunit Na+/H+ antiporter MnhA subunit